MRDQALPVKQETQFVGGRSFPPLRLPGRMM